TLHQESGLLTVTIMGIWLANHPDVPIDDILEFQQTLSQLLLSGLFILLAARMDLGLLTALGWQSRVLLAVILWITRPVSVAVATLGSPLGWRERALLAWLAPRGIVAAAVSALFALRLEALGVDQADKL